MMYDYYFVSIVNELDGLGAIYLGVLKDLYLLILL